MLDLEITNTYIKFTRDSKNSFKNYVSLNRFKSFIDQVSIIVKSFYQFM